jgi:hypothetical protein
VSDGCARSDNSFQTQQLEYENQKMKTSELKQNSWRRLAGGALVMAIASCVYAQEKPFTQAGPAQPVPPPAPPKSADAQAAATTAPKPEESEFQKFLYSKVPDALMKGKFNLNVRARYEYVSEPNGVPAITEESHAPTIRTRFGYTTAPLYGFQGMIEAENISVIGNDDNFNAAGSNRTPNKSVVADPETTEINQAWLSYTCTNAMTTAKIGRQRIALDNHRYIGDVGWRQNMQTFDAGTIEGKPIPGLRDLSFLYGYISEVNRPFGDVDNLPAANRDFESDSHILNVSYSGLPFGRFVGYAYLLDLENPAGFANSCQTYGGYFAGSAPVSDLVSLGYRAEFAYQTDYADNPQDYGAEYVNLELSASIKPVSFGAGYEILGTDSNDGVGPSSVGFKTPLSTLHAFNGWADVFLATPAKGLRDAYGFAQVTLPWDVPVRAVYHKFDADSGGADLGHEIDLMASKKFGKNWTALVKYAYYDGKDAPAAMDVQKFWAQIEFNY